ncbi:hypothetical protein DAEQUDRAFT_810115 [Daedalea quercina L-15889]|uniref:Uncharacterized protein n=1 Tax=Daedalea quercina L-15889 TaxID=1314783 RepID=A0A165RT29_9APHY|nr:hypothetical protein DAEQUDRAFT_810115 [Daedalea quercina L-15889]
MTRANQMALVVGIEASQNSIPRIQPRSGDEDEDEDEVLTILVNSACLFVVMILFISLGAVGFIRAVKVTDRLSTSLSTSPSHYSSHQQSKVPILDGRYGVQAEGPHSVAAPVKLFHSAFATFLGHAKDQTLSVPEDIVKRTAEFMHSQSKIATLESLRIETPKYLSKLLAAAVTQSINTSRTNSVHIIGLTLTSEPYQQAALAIIEEKGELGQSGDPSVQGSFSRSLDDANVLRIARVFYALRLGIKDLKTYYEELEYEPEDMTRSFFPLATSCVLPDGRKLEFKYERPLKGADPSCVTFLVADREDAVRKFVVKFVERYGDVWPTHEAATGCGSRRMVVMDYVRGGAGMLDDIPRGVRDAVHRALDLLYENGMVHGDVRAPNIMIEDAEDADKALEDSMGSRTRIIDFDWAGNEGRVRYPPHLSKTGRVEGVENYSLITAKHDDAMTEFLQ